MFPSVIAHTSLQELSAVIVLMVQSARQDRLRLLNSDLSTQGLLLRVKRAPVHIR